MSMPHSLELEMTTPTSLPPRSGYDLPLFGLDNGQFLLLHVPAIVCTSISFICAVTVIIVSFHHNGIKSFFSWNKGERLVVYLELCDAGFNFSTAMSRLYSLISLEHVRPPWLCVSYGFVVSLTMVSQALMVNAIAINAFFIMHQRYDMNFGKYDYRLLVYTVGVPLVFVIYVAGSDQFGPSGLVCSGDAIRSKIGGIITAVILILVFFSNIVLYITTWTKISRQAKELHEKLSTQGASEKAVLKVAKTMSMFVAAYFIQWLPTVIYSIWKGINSHPPFLLLQFLASVSNFGGFLNGCVYVIIRWEKLKPKKKNNEEAMLKVLRPQSQTSATGEDGKVPTNKPNYAADGISNEANTDMVISDVQQ